MKNIIKIPLTVLVILLSVIVHNQLAYRDIDMLKIQAPLIIAKRGFTITSYDGYQGDIFHGGFTWYQARDSKGYLYNMMIGEWRGELMIYRLKCLNAVTN